jgi:hypothetical protein
MDPKQIDNVAEEVRKGQRVILADIENSIATVAYMNGAMFLSRADEVYHASHAGADPALDTQPRKGEYDSNALRAGVMTLCMVVLKNGFIVIGESAAADPANFNVGLGHKFAYDNAIKKIWPLMGYALRDKLHDLSRQSPARPGRSGDHKVSERQAENPY